MLDETQKAALWRAVDRMDRREKIELVDHIHRSLSETGPDRTEVETTIAEMQRLREGTILGDDLTLRDLIDEGRRF